MPPTAGARLVGQDLAMSARQREEAPLPGAGAHEAAQLLVGMVVGAQGISVRQQHALAVKLRHYRVLEQPAAAAGSEAGAEQEIAVAVLRKAGDAAALKRLEGRAHALLFDVLVIITHPGFEQVAEDIERFGGRGVGAQKVEELLCRLRRAGVQVHVRDEQARHRFRTTSAKEWCRATAWPPGLRPAPAQ